MPSTVRWTKPCVELLQDDHTKLGEMGKRKAAKRQSTKVKTKLDKEFSCLFCNHEKTVIPKIDRDQKIGHLECKNCGESFQFVINSLSEPIDVYSAWVDACEEANSGPAVASARQGGARPSSSTQRRRVDDDDDDDDDDEDEDEDDD
ncbi:hypothetical protein HDU97_002632 [Phlyctochytrium planicorne]|nr:hypothetical protein HDU97_002632 [Phlyctochytrium planicorne]